MLYYLSLPVRLRERRLSSKLPVYVPGFQHRCLYQYAVGRLLSLLASARPTRREVSSQGCQDAGSDGAHCHSGAEASLAKGCLVWNQRLSWRCPPSDGCWSSLGSAPVLRRLQPLPYRPGLPAWHSKTPLISTREVAPPEVIRAGRSCESRRSACCPGVRGFQHLQNA
jgi:hypothetical protein